jgi:hypothetical protein
VPLYSPPLLSSCWVCIVNYRQYIQFRSSKGVTEVTNLTSCFRYKIHYCYLSVGSLCVKSPICNVPSVKLCTCFEPNLVECTLDAQLSGLQNVFPYSRNLPLDTVLSQLNSVHILTPSFTSRLSPSGFPFYFKFACVLYIRPSLSSLDWVTLIPVGEEHELWILSVCDYITAHFAYCV